MTKRHATLVLLALLAACGGREGFGASTPSPNAASATATSQPAGATDPRVTASNVHATICRPGWSRQVRPPLAVTEPIKRRLVAKLAPGHRLADFELDHDVPLELGGAPNDPANFWLEPWPEARRKDLAENRLHAAVCAGRMSLADAQRMVRDPGEWHS